MQIFYYKGKAAEEFYKALLEAALKEAKWGRPLDLQNIEFSPN